MARREPEDRPKGRHDNSLCAGHLLVWTWRKFATGQAECPLLLREYSSFSGARADALLNALAAFLQALGRGSRRTLALGHPHCAGLTHDEGQILRLIAAAQTDDMPLVVAHMAWLVAPASRPLVLSTLAHLAVSLRDSGVVLPRADYPPPPAGALLEVVRVSHSAVPASRSVWATSVS